MFARSYCDEHGQNCFLAEDVEPSTCMYYEYDLDEFTGNPTDYCSSLDKNCAFFIGNKLTTYHDSVTDCSGAIQMRVSERYFGACPVSGVTPPISGGCGGFISDLYVEPMFGGVSTIEESYEGDKVRVVCC